MSETKIEWATHTWNPVTGCSKVSSGCANCYAERMSKRLAGRCGYPLDNPFRVTLHPDKLKDPLKWKKPRRIFVNSMSDLFHDDVPDSFLDLVFASMAKASQHTFLVLTKRPERMSNYILKAMFDEECNYDGLYAALDELGIPDANPMANVWLGVSVENQAAAERISILKQIPAAVRFVSFEPLLGEINLTPDLWKDIDWAIVGGESGPGARPMHPDWVRSLRNQCQVAGTKFFFKQWGEFREVCRYNSWPKYADAVAGVARAIGVDRSALLNADGSDLVNGGPDHKVYPISHLARVGKKKAGRELDGRTWNEFPEVQS